MLDAALAIAIVAALFALFALVLRLTGVGDE